MIDTIHPYAHNRKHKCRPPDRGPTIVFNQLAVADIRAKVAALTTGFVYNGISMSSKFVSGGAYSLDGLYFNPRGSAIMANEIIKALNTKYKANIKQVNAVTYGATYFP